MNLTLTTAAGSLVAQWQVDYEATDEGLPGLIELIEAELPVDLPDDDLPEDWARHCFGG